MLKRAGVSAGTYCFTSRLQVLVTDRVQIIEYIDNGKMNG